MAWYRRFDLWKGLHILEEFQKFQNNNHSGNFSSAVCYLTNNGDNSVHDTINRNVYINLKNYI